MFSAGPLRHHITLQQPVHTLDSDGVNTCEWQDVLPATLPASIAPLSGRELLAAAAVQSQITTRIVLRHRPGITAAMRAVHRGTIYNIAAVVQDNQSGTQWITLLCSSGVNEG